MLKYYALVTRSEDVESIITSLFFPDFYQVFKRQIGAEDCYSQAISFIEKKLTNGEEMPSTLSFNQLKNFPINQSLQKWELVEIDLKLEHGFFSKLLPMIGHVTNVLSILCGGAVTFMALRIASSTHDSSESSNLSNILSTFGTVLNSIINFAIYIYSGATEILSDIGQNVDRFFSEICVRGHKKSSSRDKRKDSGSLLLRKFVSMFTIGCISSNTLIAGISTYQEVTLLVDKYLDLYPNLTPSERQQQKKILSWLVVNLFIVAGAYTILAFQGSFAAKFVTWVMDKCEKNKNELPPDVEEEEGLLITEHQGLFFQNIRRRSLVLNEYVPMPIEHEQSINIGGENEGASSSLTLNTFG